MLPQIPHSLQPNSDSVRQLEHYLSESLKLRVLNIPEPPGKLATSGSKLAILFSGGLDCTVLARMAHDLLTAEEEIDLLNVAFENPRVVQAAQKPPNRHNQNSQVSNPGVVGPLDQGSFYENCPDRITGRRSFKELQDICPTRKWNFVAVNSLIPHHQFSIDAVLDKYPVRGNSSSSK